MRDIVMILRIVVILLNLTDYILTLIGVNNWGCKELNPIGRYLLKRPIPNFLFKIIFLGNMKFLKM